MASQTIPKKFEDDELAIRHYGRTYHDATHATVQAVYEQVRPVLNVEIDWERGNVRVCIQSRRLQSEADKVDDMMKIVDGKLVDVSESQMSRAWIIRTYSIDHNVLYDAFDDL
jgi:hypothetical protein